jgi:hypothetical protein
LIHISQECLAGEGWRTNDRRVWPFGHTSDYNKINNVRRIIKKNNKK